ncbi:hypothetical protein B0H16DRAFT_1280291, partial [Mycena metata]
LLRITRSIVSGSAALRMVSDIDFTPGDLDIYTPLSQEETAMEIVQRDMNFQAVASRMPLGYTDHSGIFKVHRLEKGIKSINIIIVRGENPTEALFRFHSTVVMNCLTAFGLYCAYPSLTLSDYGVANLPVVLRDVGVRLNALECFEKYRVRG